MATIKEIGPNCWIVQSFSDPHKTHIVAYKRWGWDCDCEYHRFRMKECDHIRRVRHKKLKFHGRSVYRRRMVKKYAWQYFLLFKRFKRVTARSAFVDEQFKSLPVGSKRRAKYDVERRTLLTEAKRIVKKANDIKVKYPEVDREYRKYLVDKQK